MWNGTQTKTYNLDGPNYNKMLIYNLLCCFATRVVYARNNGQGVSITEPERTA